ncbi:MAG TPA: transketolase [Pirellulaceae bacterium]|nr:transketolase [Pirellulaceae bacterium]
MTATAAVTNQQMAINAVRTLAMDAVEAANSGHPGTPMALAPVACQLWAKTLRYDPQHPHWPARDRFVLSCGHASMLLYGLLHLSGVRRCDDSDQLAVTLDDIRRFRQLHSPCAGHPEFGEVTGAETTTGPLGQGVANSVGMALAAQWLAAKYNRPGFELFGFNVYALCSDGDLMEGIGYEAASVAGHLRLNNLCWIYDDNQITIEGRTDLSFSDDVAARFRACGWRTLLVEDANDTSAIDEALDTVAQGSDRPTLVVVRSVIGYGAPNKQDTASAHGAPLGADEVRQAKEFYGWPTEPPFWVPPEASAYFDETMGRRGNAAYNTWQNTWERYRAKFPQLAAELELIWERKLPRGWQSELDHVDLAGKPTATRNWSGKFLQQVAKAIPWLLGGSADLAESNKSLIELPGTTSVSRDHWTGRNLHFGVREHAMAAICNGLSLVGLRPYAATFFVFTDYFRPALRLSALMRQPVLYVLTHDSIGLGEDGPTHQPVEHLTACRAIPNLLVIRPADGAETRWAYEAALSQLTRPTAMVLTRQTVPNFDRQVCGSAEGLLRGGYVLWESGPGCRLILIGSGSEVALCYQAAQTLHAEGIAARVVSLPCWELFLEQPAEYREAVLPSACAARISVEAGIRMGWDQFLGIRGRFVGMDSFGASAPADVLYRHFGITVERILDESRQLLKEVV